MVQLFHRSGVVSHVMSRMVDFSRFLVALRSVLVVKLMDPSSQPWLASSFHSSCVNLFVGHSISVKGKERER